MNPPIALMAAATREAPNVSLQEAITLGSVTTDQNCRRGMAATLKRRIASGMRTTALRYKTVYDKESSRAGRTCVERRNQRRVPAAPSVRVVAWTSKFTYGLYI